MSIGDEATKMDHLDESFIETEEKTKGKARPWPVTLIAVFQFSKSAFLFVLVALVWRSAGMQWGSNTFWGMAYIASHGGGAASFLTPLLATYAGIVGIGLWRLQKWARNLLMVTSGVSAIRWLRYFAINWTISGTELSRHVQSLNSEFQRQTVYVLVFLDAFVFLCLAFFPGVADAFRVEG
jgi:hypothetical protein